MAPRWAALVLPAALLGGLPRGAGAGALRRQQPAGPRRASSASLLDKGQRKWNWESASEETKTEWGIVLKRYVMFDMNLLELEHRWDLAMPSAAAGAGPGAAGAADEQLEKVQAKVAKLHDNLEKAVLDQNTSDSTAEDMQRDIRTNHLTKEQKRTLREEHQRERFGFFAVEASAQDVLSQATALVQAIAARRARPSQSWASIVPAPATYPALLPGNASAGAAGAVGGGNGSAAALAPPADPLVTLLAKYREVVKTFRTDLGNFQNMQQKAGAASLLATG